MKSFTLVRAAHLSELLKRAIGILLLLAGVYVLLAGLPFFPGKAGLTFNVLSESKPGQAGIPELRGHFPVERILRYRLERDQASISLDVVEYRDEHNTTKRAIVYLPAKEARSSGGNPRQTLWNEALAALDTHAPADALFMTAWDNGQRIHFATGREVWLAKPVASAYANAEERLLWQTVAGGMEKDDGKARRMARWLTLDADTALAEMATVLPKDKPHYFLICLDDLARLAEIETLSGTRLPFEARIFPAADNLHAQIAAVKRWASETKTGAYLVQPLIDGAVRAWRINDEAGAGTLLARLLPFTTSLTQPLRSLERVYQSGWGGYLTIYRWHPENP